VDTAAAVPPARLGGPARLLAIAWLAAAGAISAGLLGELVLRLDRSRGREAALRARDRDVFERQWATNGALAPLWLKRSVKYRPGLRIEVGSGEDRVSVHLNSLGFRTREFSPVKPPGTVRVLCVGGSTTFAGRSDEETYPAQLERMLQARFPSLGLVEVLNLGISGTRSDYWLQRREKLFAFQPDLVVSFHFVNDLAWRHLARFASAHPWRRRLQASLLFARLAPLDPGEFDVLFDETLGNLLAMDRQCRAGGVAHLAASVPFPDETLAAPEVRRHLDLDLDFWTAAFPLYSYPRYRGLVERYDRRFESFTHRHAMDRVLLHRTPGLADPTVFVDVCHLTPEGITRLAQTLLPAVAEALRGRSRRSARPDSSYTIH